MGESIGTDVREVGIAPDLRELLVNYLRALVDVDGLLIFTNAQVDMAGHMHHVARDRHDRLEFLCGGHRELGLGRAFH